MVWIADRFSESAGIEIQYDADAPESLLRIVSSTWLLLFRLNPEAQNNYAYADDATPAVDRQRRADGGQLQS